MGSCSREGVGSCGRGEVSSCSREGVGSCGRGEVGSCGRGRWVVVVERGG